MHRSGRQPLNDAHAYATQENQQRWLTNSMTFVQTRQDSCMFSFHAKFLTRVNGYVRSFERLSNVMG